MDRTTQVPIPPTAALPDLDALIAEVGASYPLMGYVPQLDDEEFDQETALDAVIFAGLVQQGR